VGCFITVSPELQLGFVVKAEDNILLLSDIRRPETKAN